jgi:hypothetical protein
VRVFLFRVDQQLDDWPEKGQREIRWLDPAEAAALVNEGGLAEIIRFASRQPQRLKHKVGDRSAANLPSEVRHHRRRQIGFVIGEAPVLTPKRELRG